MRNEVILEILEAHIASAHIQCEQCDKLDYVYYQGQMAAIEAVRDDIAGMIIFADTMRHLKKTGALNRKTKTKR
jgi:hypothetical protein